MDVEPIEVDGNKEADLANTAWAQQHEALLNQQMSSLAIQVRGLRVQILVGQLNDELAPDFKRFLAKELLAAAKDLDGEVGK